MRNFRFNSRRPLPEILNSLRRAQQFPAVWMPPTLPLSSVSQKQTPRLTVAVSQILSNKLILKSFHQLFQGPALVRNLDLDDRLVVTLDRQHPNVCSLAIGDFFLLRHLVGPVRSSLPAA